jgi:hypothetical protein
MSHRRRQIAAWVLVGLLVTPAAIEAQRSGASPSSGAKPSTSPAQPQRDQLLKQARQVVDELTALKNSGTLGVEQAAEVDELLPLATSLSSELENPQADSTSLRELSGDLTDIQKQVSALKRLTR